MNTASRMRKNVLLQPVGDHDLPAIENEIREIKRLTAQPFRLIAVKVERWNDDLSPVVCTGSFRS